MSLKQVTKHLISICAKVFSFKRFCFYHFTNFFLITFLKLIKFIRRFTCAISCNTRRFISYSNWADKAWKSFNQLITCKSKSSEVFEEKVLSWKFFLSFPWSFLNFLGKKVDEKTVLVWKKFWNNVVIHFTST